MVTALAAGFLGMTITGEMGLSLTVEKIFCFSESSDGVGADEPYLVAITHEVSSKKFFNHSSKVFEGVDSGETRSIGITLANQRFDPAGRIFVIGLADCDNYDETGNWVMGYHRPRGLQCDTNTWGYLAADIAVSSLNRLAYGVQTAAMWQIGAPRAFKVQYMKTELARALEVSRNDCLGVGEVVLSKADLDRARKYPGKPVSIVQTLHGDDASYQVTCVLKAWR